MANKTICVLGMARSGTSLTSMMLDRLGVYFGPEQHIKAPDRFNPKGYWEHLLIADINFEIISRFQAEWLDPPDLPHGWESMPALDDLKTRATDVIREDFGDSPLWGFKSIVACMTLPFWQQIVPDMKYVICMRNPLDVARSLERRNGCSLEKGLLLWLSYTRSAIENTKGGPVHFVFTDQWMSDYEGTAFQLAEFLGNSGRDRQTELKKVIAETVDKTLFDSTSLKAIALVQQVYQSLFDTANSDVNETAVTIERALEHIRPEAEEKERSNRIKAGKRWSEDSRLAIEELNELFPVEESLILVDQDELAQKERLHQTLFPFLEREKTYWGMPENETTAINEFERMRKQGARFIAIAWPAFWLLDCYPGFNFHLRSRYPCVLHNNRLIAFDLGRPYSREPESTDFSRSKTA